MLQQVFAILFVLGALFVVLWGLRRKNLASMNLVFTRRQRPSKHLSVVDRVVLTPHHSVHLLRVHDRMLLIGVSPSGCTSMDSFAAPALPNDTEEVR